MPAFSMPFPVELVEMVISFVDYKTLTPCSLVSKTWAAICQPGFFSDLTVNYEEPYGTKRRLKRLNKILADSPHLARHFEEVTLDLYSFHAAPKAFDKYLPSILDRLTHVQSFHIISKAFNFEDFSPTMVEAIFSMLSRCPLEKLQLTRTGFESLETLLSLFAVCSESLQELDLSRVYFEADEEEFHDAALDPIEFPCLQTAVFDSEDAYSIAAHGILDMPNLSTYKHKFQLFNSQGPFVVPSFVPVKIPALTLSFLSAERHTLKHIFHLNFVKSPVSPVYLDTTRYDNLRDLTLSTQILLLDEYTALPVIANFLDRATSESLLRLEYLTIQIKLQITETRLVCPLDWDIGAWKELDARLVASSSAYLTFIVTLYTYKPGGIIKAAVEAATLKELDEAMDLLDAQFVELDKDDRLDISVERYP